MNRRSFFKEINRQGRTREIFPILPDEEPLTTEDVSQFANRELPRFARTTTGLEPYTGPWGFDQAAHLLRRTMFGPTRAEIQTVAGMTLDAAVAQLLTDLPVPSPPVGTNANDVDTPIGETWVNKPRICSNGFNPNNVRNQSLKSWWIGLLLNQSISIREKMTLFWHNHYVTETVEVSDARYSYKYNALLRQHALGNFKQLTRQVTIDPAMLKYLNGNKNTRSSPNENYARELQELFSIGKGPEIAPGDYTNYTEADVQAAARALTGWRDDSTNITSYFTSSRHDTSHKQFSHAYGNAVLTGKSGTAGAEEVDDLLNMIFTQAETARFLCRKLYRWFVYYVIDEATETNVIEPMANLLRSNNYEVKPVLSALLKSAHFHDSMNVGCVIKNPIELIVGTCRQFGVYFPTAATLATQYAHWNNLRNLALTTQMHIGDPPDVAGWPSYHQIPQFYELWINSDTLPKRVQFTDTMVTKGYTQSGFKILIDPLIFAEQVSNPSDPNIIVNEFARLLFPISITANQRAFLKDVLIPGLPDYEWTAEWNAYKADPTNTTKRNAVKAKLQALVVFMMGMSEYQLT